MIGLDQSRVQSCVMMTPIEVSPPWNTPQFNSLSELILQSPYWRAQGRSQPTRVELIVPDERVASHTSRARVFFPGHAEAELVFIKSCLAESQAFQFHGLLRTFEKELWFYTRYRDQLANLTEAGGAAGTLSSSLPVLVNGGRVGRDIHIVLTDMAVEGFHVTPPRVFHTVEQAHLTLRTLAQYHVGSLGWAEHRATDWRTLLHSPDSILTDFLTAPEVGLPARHFFARPFKALSLWLRAVLIERAAGHPLVPPTIRPDPRLTAAFWAELFQAGDSVLGLLREARTPLKADSPLILCHGDFHMWNVAFHTEDPARLKLFDFQVFTTGIPTSDIHQYLSQAITGSDRRAHVEDLLQTYTDTCKAECRRLAVTKPDLTSLFEAEAIQATYKGPKAISGFIFGYDFVFGRLIEDEDNYLKLLDATTLADDTAQLVEGVLLANPGIWGPTQELLDFVQEHIDLGTFNVAPFINALR